MAEPSSEIDDLERQLLALADSDMEALEVITRLASAIFPEGTGFGDTRRTVWSESRSGASGTRPIAPAGAESRLRRSEARLRALVDQMPAVVFLAALDEEENEVYVSPQVETLLGFTQDEWLNNPLLWYSQLHPDDHEAVIRAFTHGVQTGEPFRAEVRFFTRDGRTVWILGEAKLVRDEAGRPEYFQGIGFDITASKEAQQLAALAERDRTEIQHLRAETLAATNTELTRLNDELRVAKVEAEAAASARGTFLATMSHELRTPMNSVIVLAGLLADTRLSAAQQDMLRSLDLAANHLLTLINDILDFSRLRAGRVDLDLRLVDVAEWIETSLEIVAPRAAERDLGLRYGIEPDMPALMIVDDSRLRQVLLNLLDNALRFTEAGEIEVSLAATPVGGSRWRYQCSVRDTGRGIARDRAGELFGEFEQADGGIAREFGGTGLGLAISKSLVELMDGSIEVETEIGRGSTFTFSWSCEARAASGDATPAGAPVAPVARRRVLVIDDQAGELELLRQLIESVGCEVDATTSSAHALELLITGHRYDLVLVDYVMPDITGVDFVRALREEMGEAAPPVAITSYSAHAPEIRASGVAVAGLIPKPLRHRSFASKIVELLDGRRPAVDIEVSVPERSGAPTPLRLLVAEDSLMNQKVMLLLLGAMGYEADVVDTGDAAVAAVERTDYDVVLMDMMMPSTDGLAATRAIRALGSAVRQPHIIAVTANALLGDRDMCISAGMDDYVVKPIDRSLLADKLARVSEVGRSAPPDPPPAGDDRPGRSGPRLPDRQGHPRDVWGRGLCRGRGSLRDNGR